MPKGYFWVTTERGRPGHSNLAGSVVFFGSGCNCVVGRVRFLSVAVPGPGTLRYQDLERPATSRVSWRGEEVVRLMAERKPM